MKSTTKIENLTQNQYDYSHAHKMFRLNFKIFQL